MDDSLERLGFLPQKESIYNKLLPYAEKLDEESVDYLVDIKVNLGRSVLCQNRSDITLWINHLSRYIDLYGMKFPKEDHILFIKVLYDLIMVPDIELAFIKKAAMILTHLLKKVELLSREDLTLPWRPLYKLFETIFNSSYLTLGMVQIPGNLESKLKSVIRACNVYFPLESTQEILDEFRPCMCPFDTEMARAMNYYELFLCTALPPSEHHKGYKLWFEEFMEFWQNCHNVPNWENVLLMLLTRLAKDNIGYVDWEPYIPMIFTKLLRSFNLPGRVSMIQVVRGTPTFGTNTVSILLASMLGNKSSCQQHINSLFKALESFYHPSNTGRWLFQIQSLLQRLPLAVIRRLHRERYKEPSWLTPIPDQTKLSDQEVTDFVKSVLPAVLLSMFSKRGCLDSVVAIQHLGALRPELVIPPLLERLYSSLETLTEPHRLISSLHCVVPICHPLLQSKKYFPEGPVHVVPLLMGALPGIDPNDIKKCMTTFMFLSTFVNHVLLVDCSPAANNADLSENMQQICLATAALEDFVLQFMDRIFVLIENSCLDNPSRLDRDSERTNPEENFVEIGLYSTFGIVASQSSPAIYQVIIDKLKTFVTTHILEINVSGKYAAKLCRVVCRANPELGLKTFMPHFSKLVLALTDNSEILEEERLDDELLFSLLIMSEIVRCDGRHLLLYHDTIVKVLERSLQLTCKQGYQLGCVILKYTLKQYVTSYPLESFSVPDPWNRHTPDELHLFIDDWGKPGDVDDLKLHYHSPSDVEMEAAKFILEKFTVSEVENLLSWSRKEISLPKEKVHRSLCALLNSFVGSAMALPMWEEDQLQLIESPLPMYQPRILECGTKNIDFHGQNFRHFIFKAVREVLDYVTKCCEDDTKSLFLVIKLYHVLMYSWGVEKEDYDSRWKSFSITKTLIADELHGQKRRLRSLLIGRIHLQHKKRVLKKYKSYFTETHQMIMKDLMKLATSHYSEVRKRAQTVILNCYYHHGPAYRVIIPEVLDYLKMDPTTCHEEFKGVLHVILGHKDNSILQMRDWYTLNQVLPAIVASRHSEKPSIIKLLDSISVFTQKNFPTSQIRLMFPEDSLENAKCLLNNSSIPTSSHMSDKEIAEHAEKLVQYSDEQESNFLTLVHSLIHLVKNGNLHWRQYNLALTFLYILIRPDVLLPKEGVEVFVSHLIHDTIAVRKISVQALLRILRQHKPMHPKITINPTAQNSKIKAMHPLMAKLSAENTEKPDNFWLLYNSANLPNTQEKWDAHQFVHKPHWGFYMWPQSFEVYAPESEQPKLDRNFDELLDEEKPIYEAFTQQKFVDSVISFFSLEEKKDHDVFDLKKISLFKCLFMNFGDTFLPFFLNHLPKMVESSQESVQRCAAEIIGGVINGCKHWSFQQTHRLKDEMTPILENVMKCVTPETLKDWVTCMTLAPANRDPNKLYWLYECFMQEPRSIEYGSFLESSWVLLLLSLVSQQEWRAVELLHRIYEYILPKLDHSYQNVREKLGTTLASIFMYDTPLTGRMLRYTPKRVPFLESLMPKFDILVVKDGEEVDTAEDSPEKKSAKNLFLTICRWVSTNGTKTLYVAPPDILCLLPLLCQMVSDSTDEGFQRECRVTMAILGQSFLNDDSINASIKMLQDIASGNSWHSRVSAAAYLQTMVFSNLFVVVHNKQWKESIYHMVLKLLQDENVEVRESAAETLCGFLHCEFFQLSEELLTTFKEKCHKKLQHKNSTVPNNGPKTYLAEDLRERHSGILGLCACVNAYPYDVPEFLPDILVLLGDHLNDPQPISATIKKTLSSFRRTHHDNWRDHKLKFTDDQLCVITDLLVSPSYYA